MPIRSIAFFTYRTSGGGWTQPQLGVLRFVRAIKKQTLGGDGQILINNKEPKRLLRQSNSKDAFDWFAEMAVQRIRRELGTLRVVLVPIPNCDCVQGTPSSRTRALADAIAKRTGVATVADVLRWSKKMLSAHKGGPRAPSLLYPALRLPAAWTPSNRQYVLIDDVSTSGGHIRACAGKLRSAGHLKITRRDAGTSQAAPASF